jgi:dimethylglycine dehydrogenase
MMVMSHQYILFEENPGTGRLDDVKPATSCRCCATSTAPTTCARKRAGMNLGPYERNCRAHWATPDDPMPDDFSFQLYPDDLDRLEWYLNDAVARVPDPRHRRPVAQVINGPIPYAPDGNPLLGPMPGVPNAFEACVFTFGICAGRRRRQGAGRMGDRRPDRVGHVVLRSAPLHQPLPPTRTIPPPRASRSTATNTPSISRAHAWPAGTRNQEALAAPRPARGARRAVQRPTTAGSAPPGIAQPGDDTFRKPPRRPSGTAKAPGGRASRAECLRRHATPPASSTCPASRASACRARARRRMALDRIITGARAETRPYRPRLLRRRQGPHRHRNVRSWRSAEDLFFLITAADRPAGTTSSGCGSTCRKSTDITLEDVDRDASPARSSPARTPAPSSPMLSDADLSPCPGSPTSRCRSPAAGASSCASPSPASSAGKSTPRSRTPPTIFDAVWAAGQKHGLKPFGMDALDSSAASKRATAPGSGDLSTDYTILQGGLERFVELGRSRPSRARPRCSARSMQGVTKRFVTLAVDAGDCDAPYMSTLWHDGKVVGETTSGNWGYRHRVHKSIALGMLQRRPRRHPARRSRSRSTASVSRRLFSRTTAALRPQQ